MSDPRDNWQEEFLERAALKLYECDRHLIEPGKERPASAMLAAHLWAILRKEGYLADFPAVRINVHYGRDGERAKLNLECAHTVPDIIVHVPGADGPNIAVVEVKGYWNSDDGAQDKKKLQGYQHALESDNAVVAFPGATALVNGRRAAFAGKE